MLWVKELLQKGDEQVVLLCEVCIAIGTTAQCVQVARCDGSLQVAGKYDAHGWYMSLRICRGLLFQDGFASWGAWQTGGVFLVRGRAFEVTDPLAQGISDLGQFTNTKNNQNND